MIRSLLVLFLLGASPELLACPYQEYHLFQSENQSIGKISTNCEESDGLRVFREDSTMKLTLFGKSQLLNTAIVLKTTPDLKIQSFEYQMTSSDSVVRVNGTRRGNEMRLEKIQAGRKQTKNIPIREPLLMNPLFRPFVVKEGLGEKPKTYQAMLLEPSALTVIPMELKVSPASKKAQWKVEAEYLSQSLTSFIDSKGRLISESTSVAGMDVVAKQVSEEVYKKGSLQGTKRDLVEQAKVGFPKLENARTRKKLAVKISGIKTHQFQLDRHRQTLKGDILEIEVEDEPKETKPIQSLVARKDMQQYLKGDISIPVFDPAIQAKAKEIVKAENDLWKRAKLIHSFVYSHLEKDPFVSLPDALEALDSGKGDCNEHAVLFTALARAAGVPTRTVVGIVYSDLFYGRGKPGFYYHAWVEVFTGKDWVSMDPTWNQVPADATHIAFVEGGAEKQIQIAALMGRLKLEPAPKIVSN